MNVFIRTTVRILHSTPLSSQFGGTFHLSSHKHTIITHIPSLLLVKSNCSLLLLKASLSHPSVLSKSTSFLIIQFYISSINPFSGSFIIKDFLNLLVSLNGDHERESSFAYGKHIVPKTSHKSSTLSLSAHGVVTEPFYFESFQKAPAFMMLHCE